MVARLPAGGPWAELPSYLAVRVRAGPASLPCRGGRRRGIGDSQCSRSKGSTKAEINGRRCMAASSNSYVCSMHINEMKSSEAFRRLAFSMNALPRRFEDKGSLGALHRRAMPVSVPGKPRAASGDRHLRPGCRLPLPAIHSLRQAPFPPGYRSIGPARRHVSRQDQAPRPKPSAASTGTFSRRRLEMGGRAALRHADLLVADAADDILVVARIDQRRQQLFHQRA